MERKKVIAKPVPKPDEIPKSAPTGERYVISRNTDGWYVSDVEAIGRPLMSGLASEAVAALWQAYYKRFAVEKVAREAARAPKR